MAIEKATAHAEAALVAWEAWERAQTTTDSQRAPGSDGTNVGINIGDGIGGAGPTGILRRVREAVREVSAVLEGGLGGSAYVGG